MVGRSVRGEEEDGGDGKWTRAVPVAVVISRAIISQGRAQSGGTQGRRADGDGGRHGQQREPPPWADDLWLSGRAAIATARRRRRAEIPAAGPRCHRSLEASLPFPLAAELCTPRLALPWRSGLPALSLAPEGSQPACVQLPQPPTTRARPAPAAVDSPRPKTITSRSTRGPANFTAKLSS